MIFDKTKQKQTEKVYRGTNAKREKKKKWKTWGGDKVNWLQNAFSVQGKWSNYSTHVLLLMT